MLSTGQIDRSTVHRHTYIHTFTAFSWWRR